MGKISYLVWTIGFVIILISCDQNPKKNLFEFVDADRSKLEFTNTITENDSVNPSECLNCFNGGGVGIGDFNNDGLLDISSTEMMPPSHLRRKNNMPHPDV